MQSTELIEKGCESEKGYGKGESIEKIFDRLRKQRPWISEGLQ